MTGVRKPETRPWESQGEPRCTLKGAVMLKKELKREFRRHSRGRKDGRELGIMDIAQFYGGTGRGEHRRGVAFSVMNNASKA